MAEDYASSNPFRRKTLATAPSIPPEMPSIINHTAYEPSRPLADSWNPQKDAPKKATKKVRVQSPPPASPSTPSLPDSSSTIGEDLYANPPTPIPRDDDPFDSTTSENSEDEAVSKPSGAPLNPFSKTLQTMEHPERETSATAPTNVMSPGRASMDVEAFKRLLMTGNSGLGLSTPPAASPAHVHVYHGLGDGGSSTDTSSISRQSIFEPIQETHPESPRTSHEISEPDEDRRGSATDFPPPTAARKKPPPPSSRHGKLIKVELRDTHSLSSAVTLGSTHPPTPGSITSPQFFTSSPQNRSNTDLNKPLPPAPNRASHESDRESVFDKEAAGKTPEPPSPSASIRRKTPPAPPLARRHSQLVSDSKFTREAGRLSPKAEEEGGSWIQSPTLRSDLSRSRSDAKPPPPPSRRPASIRHSSHQNLNPLVSPSSISLPPPTPPARGSSRSISGRPPSVVSLDMSSKRVPPLPPPRHGRGSIDGGERRTSGEVGRRSTESVRKGSGGNVLEEDVTGVDTAGAQDILAEMSKLQRDIDQLRIQSERGGSS